MDKTSGRLSRGWPIAVTEAYPTVGEIPDYADAFEVCKTPSDQRRAEQWARDGFGGLSPASRWSGMLAHRYLLGFSLGPWSSPSHIFGWRIASSQPEMLHLEAKGSVMEAHMIWRLSKSGLTMTTFVKYKKPDLAAAIWSFAGNIHRSGVPNLLKYAAMGVR
jgi:hypothetical protein